MTDVLILCYHAISPSWTCVLAVTPTAFEHQISRLIERGWQATTFTQAVLDPPHRRTLAITFDDAFSSISTYAAPVLARAGAPATVFVPTAFAAGDSVLRWPGIDHWYGGEYHSELQPLRWEELRALAESGWEVGSHTCSHPHLTRVDDASLEAELVVSREACASHIGRPCEAIAYPYGDVDDRVADAARSAGYLAGGTLSRKLPRLAPYRQPRVGIYRHDGPRRFMLKAARPSRAVRSLL
jgi:peptidoglycan/xylan/chitin deacetylase (PgdA/CDA1 family)